MHDLLGLVKKFISYHDQQQAACCCSASLQFVTRRYTPSPKVDNVTHWHWCLQSRVYFGKESPAKEHMLISAHPTWALTSVCMQMTLTA